MSYSMQFTQICTICQNSEDPICTKTEDSSSTTKESKNKVLNCGHAFHKVCIDRHLFWNTDCPNCRNTVEKADRVFTVMEDPIQPGGTYKRYLSHDQTGHNTIFMGDNIPEAIKNKVLENLDFFKNPGNLPGKKKAEAAGTIYTTPSGNTVHHQKISFDEEIIYMDETGIAHEKI